MKYLPKKTLAVPTTVTIACKSTTKTVPEDGGNFGSIDSKKTLELPAEFLLAFAVHLMRMSSSDAVMLAALEAARSTGVDEKHVLAFIERARAEVSARSVFPPGFMP